MHSQWKTPDTTAYTSDISQTSSSRPKPRQNWFIHAYCTSGTLGLRASCLPTWYGVGRWTVHYGWTPCLPVQRWLGCGRSFPAGDGVLWNVLAKDLSL